MNLRSMTTFRYSEGLDFFPIFNLQVSKKFARAFAFDDVLVLLEFLKTVKL